MVCVNSLRFVPLLTEKIIRSHVCHKEQLISKFNFKTLQSEFIEYSIFKRITCFFLVVGYFLILWFGFFFFFTMLSLKLDKKWKVL